VLWNLRDVDQMGVGTGCAVGGVVEYWVVEEGWTIRRWHLVSSSLHLQSLIWVKGRRVLLSDFTCCLETGDVDHSPGSSVSQMWHVQSIVHRGFHSHHPTIPPSWRPHTSGGLDLTSPHRQ